MFWTRDGKIIAKNGRIVDCDDCPCEDKCPDYYVLKKQAKDNEWEWHEQCVIVHLASDNIGGYGDFYDIDNKTAALCAAIGDGHLYYVDCQCDDQHEQGYWIHDIDLSSLHSDFHVCIDYTGACSCVDDRELLLSYPDLFGVQDVSWGSHTLYSYTDSTYGNGMGMCGTTSFLDYRTLCVILKTFDSYGNALDAVRWKVPESPWDGNVKRESISFSGHRQPFENDQNFGWWNGTSVSWNADQFKRTTHYYQTEQEALDDLAHAQPDPYTGYGCSYPMSNFDLIINTPETTPVLHEGRVYYTGSLWACSYPWYSMGRETTYRETTVYITYRVQYLQTNKGILVNGEQGWTDALTIYGLRGTYGESDWGGSLCWDRTAPLDDTVVTPTGKDEDMHWCHPDFQISEEDD